MIEDFAKEEEEGKNLSSHGKDSSIIDNKILRIS